MRANRWILFGLTLMAAILIGLVVMSWMNIRNDLKLTGRRIELLENALAPSTARGAVTSWAEAVKSRNGAWQYALMDKKLRLKYRGEFESMNWVTGASSPWVESYQITRLPDSGQSNVQYEVKFEWATSEGYFGSTTARVTVNRFAAGAGTYKWLITDLKYSEPDINTSISYRTPLTQRLSA